MRPPSLFVAMNVVSRFAYTFIFHSSYSEISCKVHLLYCILRSHLKRANIVRLMINVPPHTTHRGKARVSFLKNNLWLENWSASKCFYSQCLCLASVFMHFRFPFCLLIFIIFKCSLVLVASLLINLSQAAAWLTKCCLWPNFRRWIYISSKFMLL